MEEIDTFKEELRLWKSADAFSNLPPLVIETYLDLSNLSPHQSLVITDSNGKVHNVSRGSQKTEVVLERWVLELSNNSNSEQYDEQKRGNNNRDAESILNQDLPVVYKQAIILFRSLYTYCRILPCWDLRARLSRSKLNLSSLSLGCRVLNGANPISSKGRIGLSKPIIDNNKSHLDSFSFNDIPCPAGYLKVSVSYRTYVNFNVSDSEALLSSQFLKSDEQRQHQHQFPTPSSTSPTTRRMSSYSPSSSSRTSLNRSPDEQQQNIAPRNNPPIIQPFKSPSLSASPNEQQTNTTVTSAPPRQPSNSSLAALRIPSTRTMSSTSQSSGKSVATTGGGANQGSVPDNAISSSASSGSSVPKYSSSFSSRTKFRPQSFTGEPSSVGSNASSVLDPGSGFYVDDVELGNFVKMVDSAKLLRPGSQKEGRTSSLTGSTSNNESSAEQPHQQALAVVGDGSSRNSNTTRSSNDNNTNPLAKFQLLRGNHAALSDSLQSSTYMPRYASSSGDTSTSSINTSAVPAISTSGDNNNNNSVPACSSSSNTNAGTSPPANKGSNHTPLVPSRLSEELTPEGKVDINKSNEEEGKEVSNSISRPLDIPRDQVYYYRLQGNNNNKESSASVSNTRTAGYEDMHAQVDYETRHQSLSPRDIFSTAIYNSSLSKQQQKQSQEQQKTRDDNNNPSSSNTAQRRSSSVTSSSRRFSYVLPAEEEEVESQPQIDNKKDQKTDVNQEETAEDDDLLFAMSDMHLHKNNNNESKFQNNPFEPLQWEK